MSRNISIFLFAISFGIIPYLSYSQDLMSPYDFGSTKEILDRAIPKGTGCTASVIVNESFNPNIILLYYDMDNYELVATYYDRSRNTIANEYRCQILKRPFNIETPVGSMYDLLASAVYSSSFCAQTLWNDGTTYIVTYYSNSAETQAIEGNCKEFASIIDNVIECIKCGNREKLFELIPRMKSLTKILKGYYPISTDEDARHKNIRALQ